MQLGEWVRAERKRRGWTIKTLAARMTATGITTANEPYLTQVERGTINPDKIGRDKLTALAAAFEYSVDAMLGAVNGTRVTVEQLRAEGVPEKYLTPINVLAPKLTDTDWVMVVGLVRGLAEKNSQQGQQGAQGVIRPAQAEHQPEHEPMGMQRAGDGRRSVGSC